MYYHAHIYWSDDDGREIALKLRPYLKSIGCQLGTVHDKPIGPHPLPMYQINYHDRVSSVVEKFLRNNCGNLSVLLHEDTGDDIKDHTVGVRWIGKPVVLDIAWLEEYTKNK